VFKISGREVARIQDLKMRKSLGREKSHQKDRDSEITKFVFYPLTRESRLQIKHGLMDLKSTV